jgi:Cu+-exporting ATPase
VFSEKEDAMAVEQLRFAVTGIHCASCAQRIHTSLLQFPGVRTVRANAATQQVKVRMETSRTTPEEIKQRLAFLGYPVKTGEGQPREWGGPFS